MEEMIVAGTVKTQYLFEPLRVMAEAVEDEALVTIFSPINSANVIKEDIKACKVQPNPDMIAHNNLKPLPSSGLCPREKPPKITCHLTSRYG